MVAEQRVWLVFACYRSSQPLSRSILYVGLARGYMYSSGQRKVYERALSVETATLASASIEKSVCIRRHGNTEVVHAHTRYCRVALGESHLGLLALT